MSFYSDYDEDRYYRRRNPFVGFIFGIILIIASIYFIWTNEANSVRLIANQNFIKDNVVSVSAYDVDRNNDGKLITVNGTLTTDETLSDSIISLDNALVLERKVEVYQKYTRHRRHRTHTYYKWSERIDRMGVLSFEKGPLTLVAKSGHLENFSLTSLQASNINNLTKLTNLPSFKDYKIVDGYYYIGDNYSSPRVGDVRISYRYALSGKPVSIIGKQNSDNTISAYQYKKDSIYVQYDGTFDTYEIQDEYRNRNESRTMSQRFIGFILLFAGFALLSSPISAIVGTIPFLSFLVDGVSNLAALVLAACVSLTTIIIAWLYYRPVLAVGLIGIIGFLIYFFRNQNVKGPGLNRQRQMRQRRMGGS